MPTFFPIFKTVRIVLLRDDLQSAHRFMLNLFNRLETVSPERSFEFTEQPEITRCQIRRIRWLWNNMGRIFGQMVTNKLSVFGTNRSQTRLKYKTSFKIVLTDPFEMPTVSCNVSNCQSPSFEHQISDFLDLVLIGIDVNGRPGRCLSSTRSRPSQNYLHHLQTLCSTKLDIMKIAECTFLDVKKEAYLKNY